jgi:hypothetical protein
MKKSHSQDHNIQTQGNEVAMTSEFSLQLAIKAENVSFQINGC